MSILDSVNPDGFILKTGHGTRIEVTKPEAMLDFWKPLYSRETVESLIEAVKAATRKESLMEAGEWLDDGEYDHKYKACELRRMANGEK